jgi:hypothetical protein
MTCYDILVQLAQNGTDKIYIDLCNKSLKVGKQKIIENGQVVKSKIFNNEFVGLIDGNFDINDLYAQYKVSVPSERDCKKHYFKALPVTEMTDAQMVLWMPRLEARVRLEAYVLLASMVGKLKWSNPSKWYWVGKDKDFVVLKKYI